MAIFHARIMLSRSFSSLSSNPLRVCVVGSGPAGFYTAEKMSKAHQTAEVDILDRLPTPFGLVRSGVAPDHPETKVVVNQFSRVAQNGRCMFFGNVKLGSSVSLKEIRDLYHVVVLAYGAESDRVLGIPGEELEGIYSAREFVWWYNGHPDCRNLAPDLQSTDTAVILGQGNVALDVARILLRPTVELGTTDVANHALTALQESSIRKVYLVGRRGPVQVACTAKELREVFVLSISESREASGKNGLPSVQEFLHSRLCYDKGIKDLYIHIQESDLHKTLADEEEMKNNRIRRRVNELLCKAARSQSPNLGTGQRELHFVFFRQPDRLLDSEERRGHVSSVRFERTTLKAMEGKQIAVGNGEFEDIECGLVLKSIGYKSVAVDGLPFDPYKETPNPNILNSIVHRLAMRVSGVVPNVSGRVLHSTKGDQMLLEEGLYVCGWLKRGPTGIIATNLYCAEETVASITEDLERGQLASMSSLPKHGREGLLQLLDSRNVKAVPFTGWEKIDAEEKRRGSLINKPREKIPSWEELLAVASQ